MGGRQMSLAEKICHILKNVGDVKAKPMVGTHNIVMNGTNLGIICTKMDANKIYN